MKSIFYLLGTLTGNQWPSYSLMSRLFSASLNMIQGRVGTSWFQSCWTSHMIEFRQHPASHGNLGENSLLASLSALLTNLQHTHYGLAMLCFQSHLLFSYDIFLIIFFLNTTFLHSYFWNVFRFYFHCLLWFSLFVKPELLLCRTKIVNKFSQANELQGFNTQHIMFLLVMLST